MTVGDPITIHVAPKGHQFAVQVHHWTPAGKHTSEGPERVYEALGTAMAAAEESQRRRHAAHGQGRPVTITLDPALETTAP